MSTPTLLVLGVGPGATAALRRLLADLPHPPPFPLVAVLQDSDDLAGLLADCPVPLVVARDQEQLVTGILYVAPRGYHLLVEAEQLSLSRDPPEHGLRPAITPLFESAAWARADRVRAVLLGRTGPDGEAAAAALPGVLRPPADAPSLRPYPWSSP